MYFIFFYLLLGTDDNFVTDRETNFLIVNHMLLVQFNLINVVILFPFENFRLKSKNFLAPKIDTLYNWNFLLDKNNVCFILFYLLFGAEDNTVTNRQTKRLVPDQLVLLPLKLINNIILFNENFSLRSEIFFAPIEFSL